MAAAAAAVRDFARFARTVYKQIFNALYPLSLPFPSVGFFSVRASCNFTQFIQNQMGFFLLWFALSSFSSFSILFYFISTVCVCVCVCVQSLNAISMVVAFLANFLYAVVGVSFGGSQLAARSLNVFITPNEWKLPGTSSCCVSLSLCSCLSFSLPPFCHKIISLVKIFHSHLCFYFAALAFFAFSCNFNNIAMAGKMLRSFDFQI